MLIISGQVNFCPGELMLKLLIRLGKWHQNLSEKTGLTPFQYKQASRLVYGKAVLCR